MMCSVFLLKVISFCSNGEARVALKLLSKIIFTIMAVNELFDSHIIRQRLMSLVKSRVVPLQLKLSSCFHANALEFKMT